MMETCPTIETLSSEGDEPQQQLPLYYLDVDAEVHVALAFVSLHVSFLNTTGTATSGTFKCPTYYGKATVCSCDITFAGKTYSTSVIDPKQQQYKENDTLKALSSKSKASTFDPSTFKMPFSNCPPAAEIVVCIKYIHSLNFDCRSGDFSLSLPTKVPERLLYNGQDISEAVSINILLNPGTRMCQWSCNTHHLVQDEEQSTHSRSQITLRSSPGGGMSNRECEVRYHAWAPTISGSCIVQPPSQEGGEGAFIVFLAPPAVSAVQGSGAFRRRVVFLLDHSGSMSGTPMEDAKASLVTALDQLLPFDQFAIIAFDDNLVSFSHALVSASPDAVNAAKRWLSTIHAASLTDILKAYAAASALLSQPSDAIPAPADATLFEAHGEHHGEHHGLGSAHTTPAPPAHGKYAVGHHGAHHGHGHHDRLPDGFIAADGHILGDAPLHAQAVSAEVPGHALPIIVLVTDGAVENEKQICEYARSQATAHPDRRTYTFGIGPYANKYFLQTLAVEGRGHSDVCLSPENLVRQMSELMSKTVGPVLTGMSLDVGRGLKGLHLYPESLPDLTSGAPLIIAGKYSGGAFPDSVQVSGSDASGAQQVFVVDCSVTETAPVVQLADKRGLEILVGRWWQAEGSARDKIEQQCVQYSIISGIPCPFTETIAYENHDAVVVRPDSRPQAPHGFVPVPAPAPHPHPAPHGPGSNASASKPPVVARNKSRPALVGGAVVLGVGLGAAVAFGSVSATLANSAFADVAEFFSGLDPNLLSSMDLGGITNMGVPTDCCCCTVPQDLCGCNPGDLCNQGLSVISGGCQQICGCDPGAIVGGVCGQCGNIDGCVEPLCRSASGACQSAVQTVTGLCGEGDPCTCVGPAVQTVTGICSGGDSCSCVGGAVQTVCSVAEGAGPMIQGGAQAACEVLSVLLACCGGGD